VQRAIRKGVGSERGGVGEELRMRRRERVRVVRMGARRG
jgi:hypothetical protein